MGAHVFVMELSYTIYPYILVPRPIPPSCRWITHFYHVHVNPTGGYSDIGSGDKTTHTLLKSFSTSHPWVWGAQAYHCLHTPAVFVSSCGKDVGPSSGWCPYYGCWKGGAKSLAMVPSPSLHPMMSSPQSLPLHPMMSGSQSLPLHHMVPSVSHCITWSPVPPTASHGPQSLAWSPVLTR